MTLPPRSLSLFDSILLLRNYSSFPSLTEGHAIRLIFFINSATQPAKVGRRQILRTCHSTEGMSVKRKSKTELNIMKLNLRCRKIVNRKLGPRRFC
eukprot:g31983.t1